MPVNKSVKQTSHPLPYLGFGIGLRPPHYQDILENPPAVDWFEIISEDYFVAGGYHRYCLEQIQARYPIVMHGVSLSIGGSDPLNLDYLSQLKNLAAWVKPAWISDHLCWTGVNGTNTHDLLPLPYTQEALKHVVSRVKQVQDYLGRQILLENASTYLTFTGSEIPEWEFLASIAEQADCLLLLDINNVYVSAYNHGFKPQTYIDAIPTQRVVQFHLAGHSNFKTHIVDTHDHDIIPAVWQLYQYAWQRFPRASLLIERDDRIPPLEELLQELNYARKLRSDITEAEKLA